MRTLIAGALAISWLGGPSANVSNQRQINELASRFIDAQDALRGLTAMPHPGEDQPRYQARINSYLRALDNAAKNAAPLRNPRKVDLTWKRIAEDAGRLKGEAALCRAIWSKKPGSHQLGPAMLKALRSLQSILNGLRDARP